MPRGFVYVTRSASPRGKKLGFRKVPTEFDGRLYFGPCKKPMRPKVRVGDWIFGLSPSGASMRRFVFVMRVEERLRYAQAYERFPALRGPAGPIHVRPVRRPGAFPEDSYEHIPGSAHPGAEWKSDLAVPELDAFLVGERAEGWRGRWLGPLGPPANEAAIALLRRMSVHGDAGLLAPSNPGASVRVPIAHGRLYTGLHLETDDPTPLLRLLEAEMDGIELPEDSLEATPEPEETSTCGAPPRRAPHPPTLPTAFRRQRTGC